MKLWKKLDVSKKHILNIKKGKANAFPFFCLKSRYDIVLEFYRLRTIVKTTTIENTVKMVYILISILLKEWPLKDGNHSNIPTNNPYGINKNNNAL